MQEKIFQSWEELKKDLDAQKQKGRRVVMTNGCFDVVHPGHVDCLTRARALGDLLVVAVNTDDTVTAAKGPGRPVTPLAERMEILAALRMVDRVTSFSEPTPLEIVSFLSPDVLAKGGDWPLDQIVGRDVVESRGGQVHSLPFNEQISTTEILNKIQRQFKESESNSP